MFKTDPGLVPLLYANGETVPDLWYLDRPLVWTEPQSGVTMIVPTGFITDDASIPKFLDWIPFADRQGASRRPGIMHDALYSLCRERGKDWADQWLRRACLSEGMPQFGAWLIKTAVHVFGNGAWNGDADKAADINREGSFVTEAAYDDWVDHGKTIFYNSPTAWQLSSYEPSLLRNPRKL